MPTPLNNVATADAYSAAATFDSQPTGSAFCQVNNAAVYYKITTTSPDGIRGGEYPERFLTPGKGAFQVGLDWREGELLTKIEFRSAVAGTPAQVSVS